MAGSGVKCCMGGGGRCQGQVPARSACRDRAGLQAMSSQGADAQPHDTHACSPTTIPEVQEMLQEVFQVERARLRAHQRNHVGAETRGHRRVLH